MGTAMGRSKRTGVLRLLVGWLALQVQQHRWNRHKQGGEQGEGWPAVVAAQNAIWCAEVRARIRLMEMCERMTVVRISDGSGALHYDVVPLFLANMLRMRQAHVRSIDIAALQRENEFHARVASIPTLPVVLVTPPSSQRREQREQEDAHRTRPLETITAGKVAAQHDDTLKAG